MLLLREGVHRVLQLVDVGRVHVREDARIEITDRVHVALREQLLRLPRERRVGFDLHLPQRHLVRGSEHRQHRLRQHHRLDALEATLVLVVLVGSAQADHGEHESEADAPQDLRRGPPRPLLLRQSEHVFLLNVSFQTFFCVKEGKVTCMIRIVLASKESGRNDESDTTGVSHYPVTAIFGHGS